MSSPVNQSSNGCILCLFSIHIMFCGQPTQKTKKWLANIFAQTKKQKKGENAKLYIGGKILIKGKQLGYDSHGLICKRVAVGEAVAILVLLIVTNTPFFLIVDTKNNHLLYPRCSKMFFDLNTPRYQKCFLIKIPPDTQNVF